MFGLLISKKEKAKMFSIPQLVITNKGVVDINQLKVGSRIAGSNGTINKVEKIDKSIKDGYFYVINNSLVLYQDQSVMLGHCAIHAKLLKRNDELTLKDGSIQKIKTIKKIKGNYYFHRLTISGDHTYYINDVLVHNASRYWVLAISGSWNATAGLKWSATSGGVGGSSVAGASDNVFFDASSGANTVSWDTENYCLSIDCTGYTGTIDSSATLNINGNTFKLVSGMTFSWTGSLNLSTGSSVALTSAGKTLGTINDTGSSGGITLQDALVLSGNLVLTGTGTFNANNFNVTISAMTGASGSPTITMGSGTWTLTGTAGWAIGASATLNANTSTIKFTNTSNTDIYNNFNGKTYNKIWFARGASTGYVSIGAGSNTFAGIRDTVTVAHNFNIIEGSTQTLTDATGWLVSGTAGNLITITSFGTTTHILTCSSGTISADYLVVQHSVAQGGASWYAGANSTNNQAVATAGSGWVFTAPPASVIPNRGYFKYQAVKRASHY